MTITVAAATGRPDRRNRRRRALAVLGGIVAALLIALTGVALWSDLALFLRPHPDDPRAALEQDLRSAKVPGAALLEIRDGKVVTEEGLGAADPVGGRSTPPDTVFTIASVSKTVTAAAVMAAVDDARVDLDADVSQYLPFRVRHPAHPDTPITARMLLQHTSGLRDGPSYAASYTLLDDPAAPDSPVALDDYLAAALVPGGAHYDEDGNFGTDRPGARYEYSNVGYGLLGLVVEGATGTPFPEYCRTALFEPLGMDRTAWRYADLDPEVLAQTAVPYGWSDLRRRYEPYGYYGFPTYPDGGLKTSVGDYGRFLSLFLAQGRSVTGEQVLSEGAVREMLDLQQVDGLDGERIGLAWHHDGSVYLHTGSDPGVTSYVFMDVGARNATVLFGNGGGDQDATGIVRLLALYLRVMGTLGPDTVAAGAGGATAGAGSP